MKLTDEQIAAIRDGTEGVTPGPWRRYSKSPHVARDTALPDPHPNVGSVLVAECGNYRDKELVPFNMDRWLADAAHIARCDPDTIRALATEALESRALLDVDRLEEIITDSIDLDWTPRTAAKAIVRAMGGGSDGEPT